MKIEIKNFGPINHLEFDLNKDLHLIYGQNAVGKSYATYCIYLLLKNIDTTVSNQRFFIDAVRQLSWETKFESLASQSCIDIKNDFISLVEKYLIDTYLEKIKKSFQNSFDSFGSLNNKYSGGEFEMSLILDTFKLILSYNKENGLSLSYFPVYTYIEIQKKPQHQEGYYPAVLLLDNNPVTTFRLEAATEYEYEGNMADIAIWFQDYIGGILKSAKSGIKDFHYLPASRSGLFQGMSSFSPIIAELSRNRHFLKNNKIELPSLAEPLADYFISLSNSNPIKQEEYHTSDLEDICRYIEEDILKGKIDYDENNEVIYKPDGTNISLHLSNASSMVSEIAPIIIYLRYLILDVAPKGFGEAKRTPQKTLLFIEEPEAHLHPAVQVTLMEAFVKMAQKGLKIFITSHSDYMFNKLNNMILSKQIDSEILGIYHLVQTNTGTINKHDMEVTDDGIDDENFVQVTEKLYNERMKIFENQ